MAQLVYIPVTPPQEGCAGNCVMILGANDPIPPVPEPLPPEGTEWVYDIWGDHVIGSDGNWVYTDI